MRTALLLLALLLCLAALPACADTGTYEILNYRVTLTPHADGTVAIDYYQQWRVTGGHIPWITVGLPNENFTITASGLAVRTIAPQNEGSWTGVRIDLDRDYQPGQTFEISFSVSQNKLFYAEGDTYKLDFWPGWYDHATVDSLTITLKYFVKPDAITADPTPTEKTDTQLVWSGLRLGEGEQFTIHVSFPKASVPQSIPEGALRGGQPEGAGAPTEPHTPGVEDWLIIGFILLFFVVLPLWRLIVWLSQAHREHYSGGRIFWGALGSILGGDDGGSGSGHGDHETGGGGGFGGGGFSCACACVSCACACACAGGGGAGCSRKLHHMCPQCEKMRHHAAHGA